MTPLWTGADIAAATGGNLSSPFVADGVTFDSREVIGSDAAYHLPSKENGFGLLKVGPRDLDPFRCFYLSAPFVVPKRKSSTGKTLDMTLTKPRLYTWQYQPLDEADAWTPN